MTASFTPSKLVDDRTVPSSATESTHPDQSVLSLIPAPSKTFHYERLLPRYSSDVEDPKKYETGAKPTPDALQQGTNVGILPRIFAAAFVFGMSSCYGGILGNMGISAVLIGNTMTGLTVGSICVGLAGYIGGTNIVDLYRTVVLDCEESFEQEPRKVHRRIGIWAVFVACWLATGFFVGVLASVLLFSIFRCESGIGHGGPNT